MVTVIEFITLVIIPNVLLSGCSGMKKRGAWHRLDDTEYYVSAKGAFDSFDGAQAFCLGQNGSLAIVKNEQIQNFIDDIVANDRGPPNGFYIGLRDYHQNGTFTWINGRQLSFTSWKPGEPNGFPKELCVIIGNVYEYADGLPWNDDLCDTENTGRKGYVCQRRNDQQSIETTTPSQTDENNLDTTTRVNTVEERKTTSLKATTTTFLTKGQTSSATPAASATSSVKAQDETKEMTSDGGSSIAPETIMSTFGGINGNKTNSTDGGINGSNTNSPITSDSPNVVLIIGVMVAIVGSALFIALLVPCVRFGLKRKTQCQDAIVIKKLKEDLPPCQDCQDMYDTIGGETQQKGSVNKLTTEIHAENPVNEFGEKPVQVYDGRAQTISETNESQKIQTASFAVTDDSTSVPSKLQPSIQAAVPQLDDNVYTIMTNGGAVSSNITYKENGGSKKKNEANEQFLERGSSSTKREYAPPPHLKFASNNTTSLVENTYSIMTGNGSINSNIVQVQNKEDSKMNGLGKNDESKVKVMESTYTSMEEFVLDKKEDAVSTQSLSSTPSAILQETAYSEIGDIRKEKKRITTKRQLIDLPPIPSEATQDSEYSEIGNISINRGIISTSRPKLDLPPIPDAFDGKGVQDVVSNGVIERISIEKPQEQLYEQVGSTSARKLDLPPIPREANGKSIQNVVLNSASEIMNIEKSQEQLYEQVGNSTRPNLDLPPIPNDVNGKSSQSDVSNGSVEAVSIGKSQEQEYEQVDNKRHKSVKYTVHNPAPSGVMYSGIQVPPAVPDNS